MNKLIYHFGSETEGTARMSAVLGGKGANLAEMARLGLSIPDGFTISTDLCKYYYEHHQFPPDFDEELNQAIFLLEQRTGKIFGKEESSIKQASTKKILLLSVRSGAKISMPGMMDTILNLGMNDQITEELAKADNPDFAFDSYRRFLAMYATVVLQISSYIFEDIYESYKIKHQDNRYPKTHSSSKDDSGQNDNVNALKQIINEYKAVITKHAREQEIDINGIFNPFEQLKTAIEAVIKSWMSPRAILYRNINNINNLSGTAVNIQSMVFGNKGFNSATGVIFTRSPVDGKRQLFGEFLPNAQGEDIVSGIKTPLPISATLLADGNSLQEQMPDIYRQLALIGQKLEQHYGDIQDIEFTIEEGKLYILQTRNGKRSAAAAVKIAVDMVKEEMITKEEALLRVNAESLHQLLHTTIDYKDNPDVIATGLPASPGAATGIAVFSSHDAEILSHHHKVILIRNDTSPEDIKGMYVSAGVITARGGMTSHAAVVARGMGVPCVSGVSGLVVRENAKFFTVNSHTIKQGEKITIDGFSGKIILGDVKLIEPNFSDEFNTILNLADSMQGMKIRANAETIQDVRTALKFGAEGIGLCRTEHMFFEANKLALVREMIIAPDLERRKAAIDKLRPLQCADFKSLLLILRGKPINIRLLDPPLHEFLPDKESDEEYLADSLGVHKDLIRQRLHNLRELNPMLGHRGCRLGISYPDIYIMQVEAILEAVYLLYTEEKINSHIELMIPLVAEPRELLKIKTFIEDTITRTESKYGFNFNIKLGTMIELPRAALTAGKIAPLVKYFSFGTNDLTQTSFGISRDDSSSFLPDYLEQKILKADPFVKIDKKGVGELIRIAIKRGKKTNPQLKLGVCGEHAGNPYSINFFHQAAIDYISCSPYRVPIARIAAAQSKIRAVRKAKNKPADYSKSG